MKSPRTTLVLLDAHAIIHRAYHALPDFASSSGEPTGALYGLISMLVGIIKEFKPDYIAAAYDLPGKTFRHEAYDDYKGGRTEVDQDLVSQIDLSRDVCAAFSIPIYEAPGFEADDMLGTIVEQVLTEKELDDVDVVIASGDMDTLQLVMGDRVRVFTLKRGIKDTITYNQEAVRERFQFEPELLVDYKGLRGDASDNIVGIKGIGEKTATTLITLYGGLEEIYAQIESNRQKLLDDGIKERIVKLLEENKDDAFFSKGLATIRRDAPVTFRRPASTWLDHVDEKRISEIVARFELRTLAPRISAVLRDGAEVAIEEAAEGGEEAEASQAESNTPGPDTLAELAIMLWLTQPDLNNPTWDDIQRETETHDAGEARTILLECVRAMDLEEILNEIELPLVPLMQQMKEHGVLIDTSVLQDLAGEYNAELAKLEAEIIKHAGHEFNVRSTAQLSDVLFNELELPTKGIKKTKAGGYSTREAVLEKLQGEHPIIDNVLAYRELHKLVSTYLEPLAEQVDEHNRLHSELIQTGAATGRFASQNPNLQNIPIRTEHGRVIRKAFIAPAGFSLVAFDYSQIELRIAAMLSGDEYMTQVFVDGGDIHRAVAARVFEVEPDAVTADMRRRAKIINFGMLYGMGVNALQKQLGTDRKDAQAFYNAYFESFPKITQYLEDTKEYARVHGFTKTLFGRKRFFPQMSSKLPFIRAMAERMAINAPIQGTEADLIKLAMKDLAQWIADNKLGDDVHMILQVHDEVVFEIKEERVDELAPQIVEIMENAFQNSWLQIVPAVPIKVDWGRGESWFGVK